MNNRTDWITTSILVLLSLTSLIVIFSIAPARLSTHATFLFVGFLLYLYLSKQDIAIFSNLSLWMYLSIVALLIIALISGDRVRGTARWIEIFGIQFQISELAKPFIIIAFAEFITKWKPNTLINILRNLGLFLLPTILIFLGPDLGTSIIYTVIWFSMMFIGGTSISAVIVSLLALVGVIFSAPHFLQEYQLRRLEVFVNPYSDPLGSGYNVIQSMIAIGSGKFFGRGLGKGTQSHLQFLPEKHTDFVYASFAEEFGFIGAMAIIGLFTFLLSNFLHQILIVKDNRQKLILVGVFSYIFFQSFLNIAMNLGVAPVTGVTLPLISVGGSSILATYVSLGFASSIISGIQSRASIEIK